LLTVGTSGYIKYLGELSYFEGRCLKFGDTLPHTLKSWHNQIDFYKAWNKSENAKEWRAKLPERQAKLL
jgi:hypothetical protein